MNNDDEDLDPPPADNNDGNNNYLAIESLEDYLQRYGLPPSNNSNDDDGRNGEFNGLNRTEAQERMEAEKAYLHAFIERHHDSTTDNNSSLQTGFTPRADDDPENGTISIQLANQTQRYNVPMKPMYRYCETVRRMTVHRSRFGVADSDQEEEEQRENSDSDSLESCCRSLHSDNGQNDDGNGNVAQQYCLELSLVEFDADATRQFISALQSLHEHQ